MLASFSSKLALSSGRNSHQLLYLSVLLAEREYFFSGSFSLVLHLMKLDSGQLLGSSLLILCHHSRSVKGGTNCWMSWVTYPPYRFSLGCFLGESQKMPFTHLSHPSPDTGIVQMRAVSTPKNLLFQAMPHFHSPCIVQLCWKMSSLLC